MRIQRLVAFLLLALVAACGSPSSRGSDPATADRGAVWQTDDDANLAYPVCGSCGADVDHSIASCERCGARVHIEAKTIACPECAGSKVCVHCAAAGPCVACEGTNRCPICDATGKWHDETCPDCEGAKSCHACASGGAAEQCERCCDTHVCANCDGAGAIVLK